MLKTFTQALGRPFASMAPDKRKMLALGLLLFVTLVLPLVLDNDAQTDTMANAMSYATLALGLNIVVGFAGLLDLGYAAFFAIGAYYYGIFTAYQVMPEWGPLWEPFSTLGLVEKINQGGPDLVHFTLSFWIAMPTAALVAALFGVAFGAPTLRLRGDYLAIVTLGFGEIVPIVARNSDSITNGAAGLNGIKSPMYFGFNTETMHFAKMSFGVDALPFYYVGVGLVVLLIFVSSRLRDSRIGRAWMAIREDETAAAAMGINLVN
jgi:branched-chain amino acid transport system permease protein